MFVNIKVSLGVKLSTKGRTITPEDSITPLGGLSTGCTQHASERATLANSTASFPLLQQQPELSSYLQSCINSMDPELQKLYNIFLIVTLYLLPLVVIAIFYIIISHHLWNVRVPGATIRGELLFF